MTPFDKAVEAGAAVSPIPAREVRKIVTAALSALEKEGWVLVPVEPTIEMLDDGHRAAQMVRTGGVSGMTIDAQIRAQSGREFAAYRAMLSARPKMEEVTAPSPAP